VNRVKPTVDADARQGGGVAERLVTGQDESPRYSGGTNLTGTVLILSV
jgi:hypothetical protein